LTTDDHVIAGTAIDGNADHPGGHTRRVDRVVAVTGVDREAITGFGVSKGNRRRQPADRDGRTGCRYDDLIGAAGAVESIISILSVKHNIIPGTINTENIDEHIPANLNIVIGKSLHRTVNYSLNNTFGFGGHTASSIFKKVTR